MKHVLFPAVLLLAMSLAQAQTPESSATTAEQSLEARIAAVDDPAFLAQLVQHYRETGDEAAEMAALERRIALRPHIGAYRLDKLVTLAREDKKSEVYNGLIELQGMGYAFDLHGDARFAKVANTKVWDYILENLDANRAPFGEGTLAWTLPREDLLPQGLAWDSSRGRLLVGSAREGKVFIVTQDGKLEPLAAADAGNGMWGVHDLAVDARRGVLWVVSTAIPHYKGYDPGTDIGRAGVFKFDLETGAFIKSYLSPPPEAGQGYFMSSIALGKDGEVYIADGVNNAIYQVRDDQFRRILHLPMLTSIAAITVSSKGDKLYFADPELGILGVELGTLKLFDVRVPTTLTLEGTVSMVAYEDTLIIAQSDMNPRRVMRLGLNPEGNTIVKVQPLESGSPQFDILGAMALDGSNLFLISNDQQDNYDRFGLLKNKDALEGVRIFRMKADFAAPELDMPSLPPGVGPLR